MFVSQFFILAVLFFKECTEVKNLKQSKLDVKFLLNFTKLCSFVLRVDFLENIEK